MVQRLADILGVSFEELASGRKAAGARELPVWDLGRIAGAAETLADAPIETIRVTTDEADQADAVVILAGDSMEPLFLPGDLLGIKQGATAAPGDYVVVRLPTGELAFRRFGGITAQGIVLAALNPRHQPMIAPRAEIVGVYRWLRRSAPGR